LPFLQGAMLFELGAYEVRMSIANDDSRFDEIDRLLNDPAVPMQPDRIWSLLADASALVAARAQRPISAPAKP